MKKKLELKSILIIVLLIASLALIILGNKNAYCLGFGAVFLSIACFLYAYDKTKKLDMQYKEFSEEYFSYQGNDMIFISECQKQMKLVKKQSLRIKIVFYGFSIVLLVFSFVSIFNG